MLCGDSSDDRYHKRKVGQELTQELERTSKTPAECQIVPDLFGFTIHLNGASLYVIRDDFGALVDSLVRWRAADDAGELWLQNFLRDLNEDAARLGIVLAGGE